MKIVIDIPEEEYRWIEKSDKTVFADVASKECMLHAIKNGTPLPKGHGRLIDADDLIADLIFPTKQFESGFKALIGDAPTIIEADNESEGKNNDTYNY